MVEFDGVYWSGWWDEEWDELLEGVDISEDMMSDHMGYHKNQIPRGKVGSLSKVQEELLEAQDAEEQGVKVMVLLELSDLVGAVEMYLEKHHSEITVSDLLAMSHRTRAAFESGERE